MSILAVHAAREGAPEPPSGDVEAEPYGRQAMMLNLRVDDLDATLARLKEKSHGFAGPATYEGIGRFAWTRTPDGHDVELWQPWADAARRRRVAPHVRWISQKAKWCHDIVSHVAKKSTAALDGCFRALAHPIRREILDKLVDGPATVGAVSSTFDVAGPTITKHLDVLEDAGLISRKRVGREQHLSLHATPLLDATSWLATYSKFWNDRLDSLEELVARLDDIDAQRKHKERTR